MKKVIRVNIGGLVFQIDNEAYDKLDSYISALRKQFEGTEGGEEIIHDIEFRIAEIFQEKTKRENREAILTEDIDEIIRVMGAPKDLEEEEESPSAARPESETGPAAPEEAEPETAGADAGDPTPPPPDPRYEGRKRFYRNADDKLLGGVCSGLATYIDADPLVVRLAFILFTLAASAGIWLYIILWILVPEARTTSAKLQQRGEKVTVESIEKAIKRETRDLQKRFKDFQKNPKEYFDKAERRAQDIAKQAEREAKDIADRAERKAKDFFVETGDPLRRMFRGGARLFAGLIVAAVAVGVVVITVALVGSAGYVRFGLPGFADYVFSTGTQSTLATAGMALVLAVPLVVLLYKAMKLMLNLRIGTRGLDGLFLAAWVVGVALVVGVGTRVAMEFQREVSYREEAPLAVAPSGVFRLNRMDDRFGNAVDWFDFETVRVYEDTVLFQDVELDIRKADDGRYALYTIRRARGQDRRDARNNARDIHYAFRQDGDSVVELSDWYALRHRTWRDQRLDLLFTVPVGRGLIIDPSLRPIVDDVETDGLDRSSLYGVPLIMSDRGLVAQ